MPLGLAHPAARKWWMGEIARKAKQAEVELTDLGVEPATVVELEALIGEGKINDKIARKVLEHVLAGEGKPAEIVEARGLAVVSDDGALTAAVEEALAAMPDVADKIRAGKVQAAGAIVGQVMKATRGQADAARVRELILQAAVWKANYLRHLDKCYNWVLKSFFYPNKAIKKYALFG